MSRDHHAWDEDSTTAEELAAASAELEQRRLVKMLWIFAFVIVCAAIAFGWKLYEFGHDLFASDGLRFAGSHLLTYVLVAGGFFLLLLYCFMRGHFADIERPKYELLETERDHDRREFA